VKKSHLQTFRAVAAEGSFSRGARRLHLSQSTASLHVRELEDELGATLFERRSTGPRPTPAGWVLLGYAQRLIDLEDEASQRVRNAASGEAESLRVAVTPGARWALLSGLDALHAAGGRAIVRTVAADRVGRALSGGGCDLAVCCGAVDGAAARRWRVAERVWVAAPGAPAVDWLQFDDPDLGLRAALDGLGAAALPRPVAQAALDDGRLVVTNAAAPGCEVWLAWVDPPSPRVRSALEAWADPPAAAAR
jgi:DNA-binding transcriptional LysR family regulator